MKRPSLFIALAFLAGSIDAAEATAVQQPNESPPEQIGCDRARRAGIEGPR